MLQVYALSVVINVVVGIVVLFGRGRGEEDFEGTAFINSSAFTLALTILSGVIAISLLMAPYGSIPVFGDLLPAVATAFGCCIFLARYLKFNYATIYTEHNFFMLIEKYEFHIAIFCISVATIHFFFPAVLFL